MEWADLTAQKGCRSALVLGCWMSTSIPEARIAMHLGTRGIEKIEARFGPENQVIASHILSLNLVGSAPL